MNCIQIDWVNPNPVFENCDHTFEECYVEQTIKRNIMIEVPYVLATGKYADHIDIARYDIFGDVHADVKKQLQQKELILIFNFSQEGSHSKFPFAEALHRSAINHLIPLEQIYYLSGDLNEKSMYLRKFGADAKMHIYHLITLTGNILDRANEQDYVPDRTSELQNHSDKFFTLLSRKPRYWRSNLIMNVLEDQLLSDRAVISHATDQEYFNDAILDIPYELDDDKNPIQLYYNERGVTVDPLTNHRGDDPLAPLEDLYSQVLFDVTCETFQSGENQFFTEKTFKPMFMGMPLLIWGTAGMNHKLKEIGFKTYEGWFDLSFDRETKTERRMKLLIKELGRVCNMLSKMSLDERIQWSTKNQSVLKYNKRVLSNMPQLHREIYQMVKHINKR